MASEAKLAAEATLLPVRRTAMYIPASPMGGRGKAAQGESFYVAENPPYGAVFTYWLRDGFKPLKEQRHDRERDQQKVGANSFYPSWDSLRAEAREEAPTVVLTITNQAGEIVRRLEAPATQGFHRVAWDLRWASLEPTEVAPRPRSEFDDSADGPLAVPGTYQVALARRVGGTLTQLGEAQPFVCEAAGAGTLSTPDRAELLAFERRTAKLQRAVLGGARALGEMQQRVTLLTKALASMPAPSEDLRRDVGALGGRLRELAVAFNGDPVVRAYNESAPPGLLERLNQVVGGGWSATCAPTRTHRDNVEIVAGEFSKALLALRGISGELAALEARAEAGGAPWTPGRLPEFKPE
jgi:hypothetical protein